MLPGAGGRGPRRGGSLRHGAGSAEVSRFGFVFFIALAAGRRLRVDFPFLCHKLHNPSGLGREHLALWQGSALGSPAIPLPKPAGRQVGKGLSRKSGSCPLSLKHRVECSCGRRAPRGHGEPTTTRACLRRCLALPPASLQARATTGIQLPSSQAWAGGSEPAG